MRICDKEREIDMKIRLTKKVKALIIVLCVIAVLVLLAGGKATYNKHAARSAAEDYLAEKYTDEMQFESIYHSWIEPSRYRVMFSPKENEEIKFEVLVQNDFTLWTSGTEMNRDVSADNYYSAIFDYYMKRRLKDTAAEIWEGADADVLTDSEGMYAIWYQQEISSISDVPESELDAMEETLKGKYFVWILTGQSTDAEDFVETEADKVEQLLLQLDEDGYSPENIWICYVKDGEEATLCCDPGEEGFDAEKIRMDLEELKNGEE